MKDPSKTNKELLEENAFLKQKIKEMDLSKSGRKCDDKGNIIGVLPKFNSILLYSGSKFL